MGPLLRGEAATWVSATVPTPNKAFIAITAGSTIHWHSGQMVPLPPGHGTTPTAQNPPFPCSVSWIRRLVHNLGLAEPSRRLKSIYGLRTVPNPHFVSVSGGAYHASASRTTAPLSPGSTTMDSAASPSRTAISWPSLLAASTVADQATTPLLPGEPVDSEGREKQRHPKRRRQPPHSIGHGQDN